jgi:hypothetical protein
MRKVASFVAGVVAVVAVGAVAQQSTVTGIPSFLSVQGLKIRGAPVPIVKSARVLGSTGALQAGVGAATATRNGTGSYLVTWTTPFPPQVSFPVCVASVGNNPGIAQVPLTPNPTDVQVNTYTLNSGVPGIADQNFMVTCTSWVPGG